MKKVLSLALAGILSLGLLSGCKSEPAGGGKTTAFVPEKEIEFVVPSAAGGGSDINARTISDLAFKNKLTPKNFMVVNKPGGNAQVAYSYAMGKKGDNQTLVVLHSGQVIAAEVNASPVKAGDMTYIGTVALDEQTICVSADGKYKDFNSLMKAAKDNPEQVKFGGSQMGGSDHLGFYLVNKYIGTKFNYVTFNSSGDALSALLGGHVDVAILNPAESIGQVEAGKLIPIATYAPERLTGAFKDTPTFKELGYPEVELREIRAISGPPNMSPEAIKFYEDLLKKVTETEEWKKNYIEKNLLTNHYLNSADTKAFHDKEIKKYLEIFKEVGVVK